MDGVPPRSQVIRRRLDELVAAYNRQDAAAVVALFAPDGRFVDIDGSVHTGPAAIEADHRARFARSPGSWFEVDQVAIADDIATATWRRHRAPDGTGAHDSWLGVDVIRFDESGSIVLKSTYAKCAMPVNERVADSGGPVPPG
jgi:uncharacterized protein (TIGR02246 family)